MLRREFLIPFLKASALAIAVFVSVASYSGNVKAGGLIGGLAWFGFMGWFFRDGGSGTNHYDAPHDAPPDIDPPDLINLEICLDGKTLRYVRFPTDRTTIKEIIIALDNGDRFTYRGWVLQKYPKRLDRGQWNAIRDLLQKYGIMEPVSRYNEQAGLQLTQAGAQWVGHFANNTPLLDEIITEIGVLHAQNRRTA